MTWQVRCERDPLFVAYRLAETEDEEVYALHLAIDLNDEEP